MTSKITLLTVAIATRYLTQYSDFLLLLDSNSTRSKKPLLAGACSGHKIGNEEVDQSWGYFDHDHWSVIIDDEDEEGGGSRVQIRKTNCISWKVWLNKHPKPAAETTPQSFL